MSFALGGEQLRGHARHKRRTVSTRVDKSIDVRNIVALVNFAASTRMTQFVAIDKVASDARAQTRRVREAN